MPSTATARNRLEQQAPGENGNTWGDKLNTGVIALVDQALDGMSAFALSGPKTLTSTNFATDEARARYLNITSGTGGTITIPNVEKLYLVRNGGSGNVVLTTGAVGATDAMVAAGIVTWIVCEGGNIVRSLSTGSNNFGTSGVIINGQTLDGLTAAGVALAEAANVDVQRGLLGLGTIAIRNKATTAQVRARTDDASLTVDEIRNALAYVAVAYAATITIDCHAGVNFDVAPLTGNTTLNLSNPIPGATLSVYLVGDSATARTVSFNANFKNPPSLTDITSTKGYEVVVKIKTATHWVPLAYRAL